MTTPTKRCDTCRWWVTLAGWRTPMPIKAGNCQRHAPVAGQDQWHRWPITAPTEACGDHDGKTTDATP